MNSAYKVVVIIFRFVAVCLLLHLLFTWLSYFLTPIADATGGGDTSRVHQMYIEGMLRVTVVKIVCAVVLYLIAPFLSRVVTRDSNP